MREETLRALISARETLSKSMRSAAEGTRDLRESMAETVASSSSLVASIETTEEQVDEYERAVAGLSRESVAAAAEQEFLTEGIDEAGEAAVEAAAKMTVYEGRVDEVGDESSETAAESAALAGALSSTGAAASAAAVDLGPFNTSLRTATAVLPAVVALLGSLGSVLGGVAVAGGGAAGVLGALFAGGLISQAEQMAATSAEIEDRGEALEQIMSELGSAIDQATEPLQTLANQEAAMSVLSGLVTLIGDLSRSAARLRQEFAPLADSLGATFWAEEARGIAELEETVAGLLPLLEDMVSYVLTELPDLIAWLRQETLRVGPALGDFATSVVPVIRELSELGGTILTLVLPPLSLLLDVMTPLLDILSTIPTPLAAAAVAFAATSAALVTYSGAMSAAAIATTAFQAAAAPLAAVLGTIAGALSLPVVAIAALVAAVAGAITYFGWWDDILNGLIGVWNGLVEVVEAGINAIVGVANWLDNLLGPILMLIPGIGQLMWFIANFGEILDFVRGIIQAATDAWETFVGIIQDTIGPIMDAIGGVLDAVDQAGGVDIGGAKIEQGGTDSGGGGSDDGSGDDPRPPAAARADRGGSPEVQQRSQEIRENRSDTTFDFSGATFGDNTSQRDIEKAVEQALEKRRSQSSDV